MDKTTSLDWIMFYKSKGIYCLPGFIGSKAPCIKWEGATKELFTDENINDWFKEERNICAHVGLSGLIVVDIDTDEDGDFTEEGRYLLHNLPETVLSRTGRGGYHFIFRNKSKLLKDKIGILPHVDIRAENIIVLPPSTHKNGNKYYFEAGFDIEDTEPADFTDEHLDIILSKSKTKTIEDLNNKPKLSEIAQEEIIPVGQRNNSLYLVAQQVIKGINQEELAWDLFIQYARNKTSGMEEQELRTIFSSAGKSEIANSVNLNELKTQKLVRGWDEPYTAKEMLDYQPEPVQWLIEDYLPLNGTTLLCSDPGVGKSMMAMKMLLDVSRGESFLGHFKTQKTKCYYFDLEMGRDEFTRRMKLFGVEENDNILAAHDSTFTLTYKSYPELLAFLLKNEVKFIVFDIFRRLFTGKENDSEVINAVFKLINSLREYGVTILLTHHNRKRAPGSTESDARGSTDIKGNVDLHLGLAAANEDGSELILTHEKSRRMKKAMPVSIMLNEANNRLSFAYNGNTNKRVYIKDKEPNKSQQVQQYISDLLKKEQLKFTEIVDTIVLAGVAEKATVENVITEMKERKRIIANNSGFYVLN